MTNHDPFLVPGLRASSAASWAAAGSLLVNKDRPPREEAPVPSRLGTQHQQTGRRERTLALQSGILVARWHFTTFQLAESDPKTGLPSRVLPGFCLPITGWKLSNSNPLAWVFFSRLHVPLLTTSTQGEKRQQILEI